LDNKKKIIPNLKIKSFKSLPNLKYSWINHFKIVMLRKYKLIAYNNSLNLYAVTNKQANKATITVTTVFDSFLKID